MPARSKSQQRLFAMVHAYNKGEFHGSRSLRKRVADLSKHISDEDARHFAKTKHDGLPERAEKKAQLAIRPENIQVIYNKLPLGEYAETFANRSERRRSFLSRILTGAAIGTVVGGAGAGALGYGMSTYAGRDTGRPADVVRAAANEAGLRCGLWGASRGALAGAITGIGIGVLDRIRS